MALIFFYVVVFCLLLFVLLFETKCKIKNHLPLGPQGFPLVGNLLQMTRTPHFQFCEWAVKYGKMYTIYFGKTPALVVNDAKLIRKLFGLMPATGRIPSELFDLLSNGPYGFGVTDGEVWVEQRKFCISTLKQFGYDRPDSMEAIIVSVTNDLCKWIESERVFRNGLVCLNKNLMHLGANVLWGMVTGEKIQNEYSEIVQFIEDWLKCFETLVNSGTLFFPWLKYFAPERTGFNGYKQCCFALRLTVERYFKDHSFTKPLESPPRDMIDACIDKVENCTDVNSSFFGVKGMRHNHANVTALLLGGGEPIGSIINWLIFYLTVHPKDQLRVQEEVDKVVGQGREPSLSDRVRMPYMEAVILETLRYVTFSPFGVPHKLLEDVEFEGYHLPKGILLFANLYHVHHDTTIWGDPDSFRPSRFLNGGENLKQFVIPFQPGRRTCPGESVAKDAMFLVAAKLLQTYHFAVDPRVENVNEYLKPQVGIKIAPKGLNLKIVARN